MDCLTGAAIMVHATKVINYGMNRYYRKDHKISEKRLALE